MGSCATTLTGSKGSGAYVVPYMVALQRKVAFPFVTVIMTLLAVPFAVTTGRRGALYGIGIGIVLAMVYWITLSLFGALGAGGVLDPLLAAWAPNILFGAAAAFMNLTVRRSLRPGQVDGSAALTRTTQNHSSGAVGRPRTVRGSLLDRHVAQPEAARRTGPGVAPFDGEDDAVDRRGRRQRRSGLGRRA